MANRKVPRLSRPRKSATAQIQVVQLTQQDRNIFDEIYIGVGGLNETLQRELKAGMRKRSDLTAKGVSLDRQYCDFYESNGLDEAKYLTHEQRLDLLPLACSFGCLKGTLEEEDGDTGSLTVRFVVDSLVRQFSVVATRINGLSESGHM